MLIVGFVMKRCMWISIHHKSMAYIGYEPTEIYRFCTLGGRYEHHSWDVVVCIHEPSPCPQLPIDQPKKNDAALWLGDDSTNGQLPKRTARWNQETDAIFGGTDDVWICFWYFWRFPTRYPTLDWFMNGKWFYKWMSPMTRETSILNRYRLPFLNGWTQGKIYRKPWIFPWNMGYSCNFSLKPIHWISLDQPGLWTFELPVGVSSR